MSEGGGDEEGPLLSQEQQLRRARDDNYVHVSKAKLGSMVGLILVLLAALASTYASDWASFRLEVKQEQQIVRLDDLMNDAVHEKVVNAEAAFENAEIQDAEAEERARAEAAAERTREKKRRAQEKRDKKARVAAEVEAKQDFSVTVSDYVKERNEKRKKRGSDKAKNYDARQKAMIERGQRQWKAHLRSMVPRDFTLPPELQKIVDEYDGSLKPPEYCYRSPKREKKVAPREPDAEDSKYASLPLEVSKKILRLASAHYPCLIAHRDCMYQETNEKWKKHYVSYDKLYFKGSAKTKEEKVARLPDFSALRLGSCAIVGNADNVLKGKYGKEIDEHDFVVRFNVVTKPYKEAVGTKAHGIFYKTNYKSDLKPKMFNFFPKYVPMELDPKDLPGGVPPLIHSRLDLHEWRFDLEQMFWAYLEEKNMTTAMESFGVPKLPHATGGIGRLRSMVHLLRLGVCDRLDVYGFSVGGGKYFERNKVVSRAHPIQAENYVFRLLMATGTQGKLCVYGK